MNLAKKQSLLLDAIDLLGCASGAMALVGMALYAIYSLADLFFGVSSPLLQGLAIAGYFMFPAGLIGIGLYRSLERNPPTPSREARHRENVLRAEELYARALKFASEGDSFSAEIELRNAIDGNPNHILRWRAEAAVKAALNAAVRRAAED